MKADLGSEKSGYLPVAQAISQIGAEEPICFISAAQKE